MSLAYSIFCLSCICCQAARMHWADYLVLALMLVISLAIGVYYSFAGGKQVSLWKHIPVFFSNRERPWQYPLVMLFIYRLCPVTLMRSYLAWGSSISLVGSIVWSHTETMLFKPSIFKRQSIRWWIPAAQIVCTPLPKWEVLTVCLCNPCITLWHSGVRICVNESEKD